MLGRKTVITIYLSGGYFLHNRRFYAKIKNSFAPILFGKKSYRSSRARGEVHNEKISCA
jgi:hypothetical protein